MDRDDGCVWWVLLVLVVCLVIGMIAFSANLIELVP